MGMVGRGQGTHPRNPFVGRAPERATIDALLGDAERGVAGALLLAGPAGIGKSALLQYAIDQARDFRVVRVTGVESEMAFDYAGVHQVVLPLIDCLEQLPGLQRATLDAVLGRSEHEALDPFLVGLAVLSLVAEAARVEPLLAVIDDAQWLDDESVVALSFVGRRLRGERVRVTCHHARVPRHPRPVRRHSHDRRRRAVHNRGSCSSDRGCGGTCRRDRGQRHRRRSGRQSAWCSSNCPRRCRSEQLRGTAPLPDPLPIGERLSGLFAERARALEADAQMVLLLAAAERLGDPTLLRRAADAIGDLSWGEAAAKRRVERTRLVHPERRVPSSARSLRDLLLGCRQRSTPRPCRARRGARCRRRRRPSRVAPRRRRDRA